MSHEVTFRSEKDFLSAISPYPKEQVSQVLDHQGVKVSFDPSLPSKKVEVIPQTPNLFYQTVFKEGAFKVCYPERPRVAHQLSFVFDASIQSLLDLKPEDRSQMQETLKKIYEVYQSVGVNGFVLAQYEKPQARHEGRCVMELLPHQDGVGDCRDFLDKADSNRYVLYGDQSFPQLVSDSAIKGRDEAIAFWKDRLSTANKPIEVKPTIYPMQRADAHFEEGAEFAVGQLLTYFAQNGAFVKSETLSDKRFVKLDPKDQKVWETARCVFCVPEIVKRQTIFEHQGVCIMNNIRKMPHEGTSFLVIPKRHLENDYALTQDEAQTIALLEKALILSIREKHPDLETIIYNQNHFSVGQTVPHTHDQVVAVDPKRVPFHWSMLSLSYVPGQIQNIEPEEMKRVIEEFSVSIQQNLDQLLNPVKLPAAKSA